MIECNELKLLEWKGSNFIYIPGQCSTIEIRHSSSLKLLQTLEVVVGQTAKKRQRSEDWCIKLLHGPLSVELSKHHFNHDKLLGPP